MYKAIIIDNESMARMLLREMIEQYCPQIKIAENCADLPTGIKAIHKHKPDIVFLDIEMPGHSGLELLDFFDENDINFSIIFTTAYQQYAIQAFKMSAIDYLLTPIDAEELIKAVSMFQKKARVTNYDILKENLHSTNKKIALSTSNSILFIPLDNILFFKADGSYTNVYLQSDQTILTSKNLKYYEDLLTSISAFYRCHKSFIVNTNHINEYAKSEGGYLRIAKHQINISSEKISVLLEKRKI